MIKRRRILLAILGVILVGAALAEHLSRRALTLRNRNLVQENETLKQQFSAILKNHYKLTSEVADAQARSQALSDALSERDAQLEEAVARLGQESSTIERLQARLMSMEQQMGQLQSELALKVELEDRSLQNNSTAIELERILISTGEDNPGMQGYVLSVDEEWGFIVVNFGWDAVQIGDMVSIVRSEQLLAKARIERVQEDVAAAAILPEWRDVQIQVDDMVHIL